MIGTLGQAAITVAFGAIAGGVTNAVAIWMLFHPREPVRLFGRPREWLHGAIPKNQARLARALGRTVATQLLTANDLERMLTEPEFRAAFEERLSAAIDDVLNQPRPSLRELLPPAAATEVESLLRATAAGAAERLDEWIEGEAFRERARGWARDLVKDVSDRPIDEVLTPEREAALAESVDQWLADTVTGPGFDSAVRESVARLAERVLVSDRTFQDVLPAGLVAAAERAIAAYLPTLLERFGRLLEEPDARKRVQQTLHGILDRFMADLKFHQRIVAALLIPPDTVDRLLRVIEKEGADRISELMRQPDVRDAMARGINEGVVDFLRRPVTSVLGEPGDAGVQEAEAAIGDAVLRVARDGAAREFLVEKVRGALGAAERRTWGDLLKRLPSDRVVDFVVEAARGERARAAYRQGLDRLVDTLMDRPIGRPVDHLPQDAAARLEAASADPLWHWIAEQVPHVAGRIDIAARVEEKVLEFPPEKLEALVRGVIERELVMIINLGYVLGAFVGLVLVGVNILLG